MKRTLIILVLLLGLASAALCEGNLMLPLPENENISGLLAGGDDTLYIFGDGLFTWKPGDETPTAWTDKIDLPGPEDEEGEGFGWRYTLEGLAFFMDGGALRGGRLLTDGDGKARALQLCDIVFSGAGAVEARNVQTLNTPAAIRDSGLYGITNLCVQAGVLYLLGNGDEGLVLCAVDSADPKAARAEALGWEDYHLLAAPDGPILVEEGFDEGTRLYRVRPDGSREALCDLPPFTGGAAVDPVAGTLYAAVDGRVRVVDIASGALGEPVSALPLQLDGAVALNGRYCAWMRNDVAVLDAETPLDEDGVVSWSTSLSAPWLDKAMLEFAVVHPELTLAKVEARMEDTLDGMLTQSRDVDVYITDTRDGAAAYWALLDRGYMLPLERPTLRGFYERMYPGLQRATASDGAFAALPVYVNGRGLGVDESLLNRLGLEISDVPGDWPGFLTFLEDEIRPRLSDLSPDARFTYADLSADGFRYYLRMNILNAWVNCAAAAGVVPDYGDARLVDLLERVDAMDFVAYGLPEANGGAGDEWFGYGYSYGSGDRVLIQFSAPYDFDDDGVDSTPLPLGFGDDLPGTLPLTVTVAFVNPYTAHPEAALDLMEAILRNLPQETEYALCGDMTEPVARPEYDRVMATLDEEIARLQGELDAAQPRDRQALEEELRINEKDRDDYREKERWLISPERLAWYRANGDRICVTAPSWFDEDTSGEAWQLLKQYEDGLIPARQFLAAVSQKARMMALEGE